MPEVVELTPEQERKWADTMLMMQWQAPGFRHLFYRLLDKCGNKHTVVPTKDLGAIAATDGSSIAVDPDKFFALSLPERVYVIAHEVVHNVYSDPEFMFLCRSRGVVPQDDGTTVPFDEGTMNKAMDYRINPLLDESRIGKGPALRSLHAKVTSTTSLLESYRRAYEEREDDDGKGDGDGKSDDEGEGGGNNPGGFDKVQNPGQNSGQNPAAAAAERNQGQWQTEVKTAAHLEEIAKGKGSMPGALKRLFKEILEPEVSWLDHIQTMINRAVGDGGYDWQQPDPWLAVHDIYSPKPTGHGAGWIVIWGDTSGSRSDLELQSNMRELAGMLEDVQPERLTVIWCDAEIGHVDEITDVMDLEAIKARGVSGGGGTEMGPVLDWIEKEGTPDLFIGFTDGYVDFPPKELPYPTIWASSTDVKYPFGQVVRVNKVPRKGL